MKGIAGLMAMMAAVVLAMMIVGFSIPISQSLGNEAGEAVTDIGAVAQLNAYTSNYVYDYSRQAARYSIHNTSYELANGGGEVDWGSSTVAQQLEETYACGDENPLQKMNCKLQEEAAERTAAYGWEESSRCTTDVRNPYTNLTGEYSTFNASSITLDCDIKQRSMSRTAEDVELNFSTNRVRFQALSHTAYSYMHKLQEDWNSGSYTGDARSCGSPGSDTYAEAEEEAADNADSALQNSFDAVSVSKPDGVEIDSSILDIPEDLEYGTDPSNFEEADQSFEVSSSGICCEKECGEGGCVCVADYHTVEATVEPEESQAELSVEDIDNEVLLNDGWENIVFRVENYVHSFS